MLRFRLSLPWAGRNWSSDQRKRPSLKVAAQRFWSAIHQQGAGVEPADGIGGVGVLEDVVLPIINAAASGTEPKAALGIFADRMDGEVGGGVQRMEKLALDAVQAAGVQAHPEAAGLCP